MPEPHDAELIIHDTDPVKHWIGVYREHIETSRAIAASTDLDSPCARTDLITCNVRRDAGAGRRVSSARRSHL